MQSDATAFPHPSGSRRDRVYYALCKTAGISLWCTPSSCQGSGLEEKVLPFGENSRQGVHARVGVHTRKEYRRHSLEAAVASAHESSCGLALPHQEQMRERGPAFEEDSAPPPGSTVCWGRSLALLASDDWLAPAAGTDDSSWRSQLVAGA